jgi:hypothetical protein
MQVAIYNNRNLQPQNFLRHCFQEPVREDEIVVLRRKVDTGMGEKDPVRKVSKFFLNLL